MTSPNRRLPVLLFLAVLLVAACAGEPDRTPDPTQVAAAPPTSGLPATTERPFEPGAWPVTGSACDDGAGSGATSGIGRIETVSDRTVRFTLCAPDGAFLARLAHPAMGIVDASSVDVVAADPSAARLVPGAGTYRVEAWTPGENVRLARVAGAAGGTAGASPDPSAAAVPIEPPSTIILRWATASADRMELLRSAAVDGIDAPGPADLSQIEALPELTVVPRPGLATAYLGFGTGHGLDSVNVRRAFAEAIDVATLAQDAFPAGSVGATHTVPCVVVDGCAGADWYAFNGPEAAAGLANANVDLAAPIPLRVPDAPLPGLPDPAGVAAAVRDQLKASVGATIEIDVMRAADLAAAIAGGSVDGLYLGGVASSLADPSGYLGPLFGAGATGTAAGRTEDIRAALGDAAAATEAGQRTSAFERANDAVRSAAPIVPLVHPGSTSAFRADVAGLAVSPMGDDPLGSFVPADRHQLVVMGASEPAGSWCAAGGDAGALRLCGLVTPGLYAFDGTSLAPVPALASWCAASGGARVWTCRLRTGLRFTDGKAVDAGDVLASLAVQADMAGPLRRALPPGSFAAWDELFNAKAGIAPTPSEAPSPAATVGITPSPAAAVGATPSPTSTPGTTPAP